MTEESWIELFQDFWDDGYFAGLEAGIRDKTKWSPEVGRELYIRILTAGGSLPLVPQTPHSGSTLPVERIEGIE